MRTFYFIIAFAGLHFVQIAGQCSEGNPSMDYGSTYNTALSIEANFTLARRWEEVDRGLPVNCLGDMIPPNGGWSSLSDEERALYIVQQERLARGLLPLQGMETNLNSVSLRHSTWLIENNRFSHVGDPSYGTSCSQSQQAECAPAYTGSCFWQRIDANASLFNCYQSASENVGVVTGNQDVVAVMLFGMLYNDMSCCGWGHRINFFATFNNDYGDPSNEGFIGIGIHSGSDYLWPFSSLPCPAYSAKIITFNLFDPSPSASCQFDPLGGDNCPELITLSGNIEGGTYQAQNIVADGSIINSEVVDLRFSESANLSPGFTVEKISQFSVTYADCSNSILPTERPLYEKLSFRQQFRMARPRHITITN